MELPVYSAADPDACATTVRLDEDDARTLGDLLGTSKISEHLVDLQPQVEGLVIDWLHVEEGAEWANRSLRDAAIHSATGVSVVAITRRTESVPAPRSTEVMRPGDVAVCIDTAPGLAEVRAKLQRGG